METPIQDNINTNGGRYVGEEKVRIHKSTPDRLRRLDALFAEKVLGCPAPICACEYWPGGQRMADGVAWCCACKRPHADPYTRSLDAAWVGAAEHFPIIELHMAPRAIPFHAEVERDGFESMDDADHPAEALVLACLRAVGCSEEELT